MNTKLDDLVVNLQKSEAMVKKKSTIIDNKEAEIQSLNA